MCTVSFIPAGDKVFITHNRDEKSSRTKALPPKEYTINGYTLLFPRDSAAGGSWIACSNTGAAAVLLNGGFTKHLHQPPYRKSRGLAFLDIVASGDLIGAYHKTDLGSIEPFTMILWDKSLLFECRWDGETKHITTANAHLPHTWSSVTLYDAAIIARRKTWFDKWLQLSPAPSMEAIIQYHLSAGDGDTQNDLRMNRDGKMLTVSVTAMEISYNKSIMQYIDLQDNTRSTHSFNFTKAAALQ
jgi:Transport and Golgi organisation 2